MRVEYFQPEKFRDAGEGYVGSERSKAGYLAELRGHIQKRAAPLLAEGQTLTVTITDVDLAGEFEPWRFPNSNVRVVKDVYPPRIDLRFRLAGADGTVLREGERKLSDINFLVSVNTYPQAALRYEKALIDAWLAREFPRGT